MKKTILFLFFAIALSQQVHAQTDSIRTYIMEALSLMKTRSVNKATVNWDKVYTEAFNAASNLKSVRATYPIIKAALANLNDAHSKFFPPEMVQAYLLGYRATGQQFPVIDTNFLNKQYAYISLPAIASYNFNDWNEYVSTFYLKVAQLQTQQPKGWIIDLRDNDGGMFYPMYAALSVFTDQQKVIGVKDGEGKLIYFGYKNGKLYEQKKIMHRFKLAKIKLKKIKQPIVVLINKRTASSGEFAAISFAGQKNITIIGENTAGLTSANQEHKLKDGAFLVLTEGNTIDRNGKEYAKIGEGLIPDLKIENLPSAKNDELYFKKAIDILNKVKRK
ncbi:MAG: S41 family peptidase [Bacteroidota bacterium]